MVLRNDPIQPFVFVRLSRPVFHTSIPTNTINLLIYLLIMYLLFFNGKSGIRETQSCAKANWHSSRLGIFFRSCVTSYLHVFDRQSYRQIEDNLEKNKGSYKKEKEFMNNDKPKRNWNNDGGIENCGLSPT